MEQTIKPIIQLPPGVCRYCRSPLKIINSEMVCITINENGSPMDSEVYKSSTKGVCPKCLKEYPMKRRGLFYVPERLVFKDGTPDPLPRVVRGLNLLNPFKR